MLNIHGIIGEYKMLLNSNFYKATLNYNTDGHSIFFFYYNPPNFSVEYVYFMKSRCT